MPQHQGQNGLAISQQRTLHRGSWTTVVSSKLHCWRYSQRLALSVPSSPAPLTPVPMPKKQLHGTDPAPPCGNSAHPIHPSLPGTRFLIYCRFFSEGATQGLP